MLTFSVYIYKNDNMIMEPFPDCCWHCRIPQHQGDTHWTQTSDSVQLLVPSLSSGSATSVQ